MDARLELSLPPTERAPGIARRRLAEWLAPALGGEEVRRAKLLTSELITNAVVHGQGNITLRAELDDDRLLVEVMDHGHGFERVVREQDFETIGGYGLTIVEAESSRWGIHEGTTHVWFELERPGPRLGVDSKPSDRAG